METIITAFFLIMGLYGLCVLITEANREKNRQKQDYMYADVVCLAENGKVRYCHEIGCFAMNRPSATRCDCCGHPLRKNSLVPAPTL